MKRTIALILAVLMMATLFVGCGAKTDDSATQPTTEAKPEAKEIIVGYTDYAPMNYKDESGKLVGFDTELAEAVFTNLGYTPVFKEINWDYKYTNLDTGVIDCIWNGFTCNTKDDDGIARAEKVDFSYNYMENRQVVVAKKGAGITDAASLTGKIGCAENSSAGQSYAAEKFADSALKGFTAQTDCLREVKLGTADFAVLDAQLAKSYCGKGDYAELEIIAGLDSDVEYYAIGFKKNSALTAQVNAELEKLAADGTIAKLAEKYGVSNTAITDFSDQKK